MPRGSSRGLLKAHDPPPPHTHTHVIRLATGDVSGRVVIWDAGLGKPLRTLTAPPTRPASAADAAAAASPLRPGSVVDMQWVSHSPTLLAVVAYPNVLTIWDADAPRPLWRRDGGAEPATFMRVDPLDRRRLAITGLRGTVALITLRDVSAADGVEVLQYRVASGVPDARLDSSRLCALFPYARQIVYLVLPREIIAFDMAFGVPVANTAIPRSYPPFTDVLQGGDEGVLLCSHADGSLTVWTRKPSEQTYRLYTRDTLVPANPFGPAANLQSAVVCDDVAAGRKCIVSVLDDGRVIRWAVPLPPADANDASAKRVTPSSPGAAPLVPMSIVAASIATGGLVGQSSYQGLSGAVTCIATAPYLGVRGGRPLAPPLVAVGTSVGSIELVDMPALAVSVSLAVHATPVKGLAWLGVDALVSYSSEPTMGGANTFRNAIMITDIVSGHSRPVRRAESKERGAAAAAEPFPIRAVKAFACGGLFAVLLRGTVEVWTVPHGPDVPRGAAASMIGQLNLGISDVEWLMPWPVPPARPDLDLEKGAAFLFGTADGKVGSAAVEGTWHGGRRLEDKPAARPGDLGPDFVISALGVRGNFVAAGDEKGNLRCWNSASGWCAKGKGEGGGG